MLAGGRLGGLWGEVSCVSALNRLPSLDLNSQRPCCCVGGSRSRGLPTSVSLSAHRGDLGSWISRGRIVQDICIEFSYNLPVSRLSLLWWAAFQVLEVFTSCFPFPLFFFWCVCGMCVYVLCTCFCVCVFICICLEVRGQCQMSSIDLHLVL